MRSERWRIGFRFVSLGAAVFVLLLINQYGKAYHLGNKQAMIFGELALDAAREMFIALMSTLLIAGSFSAFRCISWRSFLSTRKYVELCIMAVLLKLAISNILLYCSNSSLESINFFALGQKFTFPRCILMFTQAGVICPLFFILSAKLFSGRSWKYSCIPYTIMCVVFTYLFSEFGWYSRRLDFISGIAIRIQLSVSFAGCLYFWFLKKNKIKRIAYALLVLVWISVFVIYEFVSGFETYINHSYPIYINYDNNEYFYASFIFLNEQSGVLGIMIYVLLVFFVLFILIKMFNATKDEAAKCMVIGPLSSLLIRWLVSLELGFRLPVADGYLTLPFCGHQEIYEIMLLGICVAGYCVNRNKGNKMEGSKEAIVL